MRALAGEKRGSYQQAARAPQWHVEPAHIEQATNGEAGQEVERILRRVVSESTARMESDEIPESSRSKRYLSVCVVTTKTQSSIRTSQTE